MFVRITFWLVLCLFIADIAQPGYLKFWQPKLIKSRTVDVGLPRLKSNLQPKSSLQEDSCPAPDNDLEAIIQARFDCKKDASPD
ncbi:MAG: hypothetical protein HC815_09375 [Richelia sp. RM1_1_1]|nr:hypothetical protein [Richelia sp. RM1_1_1]